MAKIKKRLKHPQGQVAIFVLMMFSLIFMLFGMAINVGMLVHHKINLQNAADMAALAGAAEEGRILNMIGWKNYELRKNFKDFMYRYWVQFNDRHPLFPHPQGRSRVAPALGKWTNNIVDGSPAAPSYCPGGFFAIKDRESIKACELTRGDEILTEIVGPPLPLIAATIEPVSTSLLLAEYIAAQNLSSQAVRHWYTYGRQSFETAWTDVQGYWKRAHTIYNTYLNPNLPHTLTAIMNAQSGNFPEIPPQAWQNFVQTHILTTDPLLSTRAYTTPLEEVPYDFHSLAQATAYNNLNFNLRHNFEFIELSPENHTYIDIAPMEIDFTVFFTTFPTSGNYIVPNRFNPINVGGFIVGVEKTNPQTFYAVMLKSKPELPFLPGDKPWELTAVAAAKPFGSRIGPRFHEDDYTVPISGLNLRYPNLPLLMVDENQSIDDTQLLHDLKLLAGPFESPSGREDRLLPFLRPSRWDAMRYVFPNIDTSKQAIHSTDLYVSEQANLGIYPAAIGGPRGAGLSSWSPIPGKGRSGYSIKLIRVKEILPYIDPLYHPYVESIEH